MSKQAVARTNTEGTLHTHIALYVCLYRANISDYTWEFHQKKKKNCLHPHKVFIFRSVSALWLAGQLAPDGMTGFFPSLNVSNGWALWLLLFQSGYLIFRKQRHHVFQHSLCWEICILYTQLARGVDGGLCWTPHLSCGARVLYYITRIDSRNAPVDDYSDYDIQTSSDEFVSSNCPPTPLEFAWILRSYCSRWTPL